MLENFSSSSEDEEDDEDEIEKIKKQSKDRIFFNIIKEKMKTKYQL
jgi:hypothetical protein